MDGDARTIREDNPRAQSSFAFDADRIRFAVPLGLRGRRRRDASAQEPRRRRAPAGNHFGRSYYVAKELSSSSSTLCQKLSRRARASRCEIARDARRSLYSMNPESAYEAERKLHVGGAQYSAASCSARSTAGPRGGRVLRGDLVLEGRANPTPPAASMRTA